jgi:hypothetical protein
MSAHSTNREHDASLAAWVRARDVLAGEDAVKSAGTKYLPRMDSQIDQEYEACKARASFFGSHSYPLGVLNYPQHSILDLDSFYPGASDTLDPKNNVNRWHIQSLRQSPRGDCLRPRKCYHSAASDENSFSGHRKSQKVTKSHLCSPLAAPAHSRSACAWLLSHEIPPLERQYGQPIQCLYSQRVAVQNHIVKVKKRNRALVNLERSELLC